MSKCEYSTGPIPFLHPGADFLHSRAPQCSPQSHQRYPPRGVFLNPFISWSQKAAVCLCVSNAKSKSNSLGRCCHVGAMLIEIGWLSSVTRPPWPLYDRPSSGGAVSRKNCSAENARLRTALRLPMSTAAKPCRSERSREDRNTPSKRDAKCLSQ